MKTYVKMPIFRLFADPMLCKEDDEVLEEYYDDFAGKLFSDAYTNEPKLLYSRLLYTLTEIENSHWFVVSKKNKQSDYCKKCHSLLKGILKLVKWQMNNSSEMLQAEPKTTTPLRWTGNVTELVEFAYALLEAKSFNDGNIEVNALIKSLCEMFDFKVKDCYRVFSEIRKRDDRTRFLDKLRKGLMERIERLDSMELNRK